MYYVNLGDPFITHDVELFEFLSARGELLIGWKHEYATGTETFCFARRDSLSRKVRAFAITKGHR